MLEVSLTLQAAEHPYRTNNGPLNMYNVSFGKWREIFYLNSSVNITDSIHSFS